MNELKQKLQAKEQGLINKERERVLSDIHYFASEYLGMKGILDSQYHRDVCKWMDKMRRRGEKRAALFIPRGFFKSSLLAVMALMDIIENPSEAQVLYIHHNKDRAMVAVEKVGKWIQDNPKVRRLIPVDYLPAANDRRWLAKESFTLAGRADKCDMPTMQATSINVEFTGGHPNRAYLDDIVNPTTIQGGGNEAVKKYVQVTLSNILGVNPAWLAGTVFTTSDFHWDIIQGSAKWASYVKPLCWDPDTGKALLPWETNKETGNKGVVADAVYWATGKKYTIADVKFLYAEQKADFWSQNMMVPNKDRALVWDKADNEKDIYVSWKDVSWDVNKTNGRFVILVDPAPKDVNDPGKDGGKDYWAISVMAYYLKESAFFKSEVGNDLMNMGGKRLIKVLVDGEASNDWTLDDGFSVMKRFMMKYNTPFVCIEEGMGAARGGRALVRLFEEDCRRFAARPIVSAFEQTQTRGKALRIADLAMQALIGEFKIADDKCDPDFLDMFFEQIRTYAGKDSIRFDDVIDCVSYLNDPAVLDFVPAPVYLDMDRFGRRPERKARKPRLSRYCRT